MKGNLTAGKYANNNQTFWDGTYESHAQNICELEKKEESLVLSHLYFPQSRGFLHDGWSGCNIWSVGQELQPDLHTGASMCMAQSVPEQACTHQRRHSCKKLEGKAPSTSSEAHHMHLFKADHSPALRYFAELGCGVIINKIEIN